MKELRLSAAEVYKEEGFLSRRLGLREAEAVAVVKMAHWQVTMR